MNESHHCPNGDAPGLNPVQAAPAAPDLARLTHEALAIVLAGGRGERLGALTAWRAKPSVPFGGKFRIIDFVLSNCVNSGVRRIGICTQYRAQSLIRHVQRGWSFFDGRFNEFVELLPAQQRSAAAWYRGTADAVFQNLDLLRRQDPRHVLVLAADHVYKMNYASMLSDHVRSGARMTIGCVEVPLADARGLGVMTVDADGHIIAFAEKPANPSPLPDRPGTALASMGIYVFDTAFLCELLDRDARDPDSSHDFGKDIIPGLLTRGERLFAHRFSASCVNMSEGQPYWRDVGTLDAYWEANMELTAVTPPLNLYDEDWPIWTYQEQLPPAKFVFDDNERRGNAVDSLVSGGCIISGAQVRRSVLFSGVRVNSFASVEDSVILPGVSIGRHARLRRVIVDRQCRVPDGLQAGFDPVEDARRFCATAGGIVLITPEMLGQHVHSSDPAFVREVRMDATSRSAAMNVQGRTLVHG
jgi:glucose-1-phosphate adenylyltransferase